MLSVGKLIDTLSNPGLMIVDFSKRTQVHSFGPYHFDFISQPKQDIKMGKEVTPLSPGGKTPYQADYSSKLKSF